MEGKIKVRQVERDVEKRRDRQVEEVRRSSSASQLKRAGAQIKAGRLSDRGGNESSC